MPRTSTWFSVVSRRLSLCMLVSLWGCASDAAGAGKDSASVSEDGGLSKAADHSTTIEQAEAIFHPSDCGVSFDAFGRQESSHAAGTESQDLHLRVFYVDCASQTLFRTGFGFSDFDQNGVQSAEARASNLSNDLCRFDEAGNRICIPFAISEVSIDWVGQGRIRLDDACLPRDRCRLRDAVATLTVTFTLNGVTTTWNGVASDPGSASLDDSQNNN